MSECDYDEQPEVNDWDDDLENAKNGTERMKVYKNLVYAYRNAVPDDFREHFYLGSHLTDFVSDEDENARVWGILAVKTFLQHLPLSTVKSTHRTSRWTKALESVIL